MKIKRLVAILFCMLFTAFCMPVFAENKMLTVQAGGEKVLCLNFDGELSFFIPLSPEVKGFSDFGSSLLLLDSKGNMLMFGRTPLSECLSDGQIKKMKDKDKLKAFYVWEKAYQEKEYGRLSGNGMKVTDEGGTSAGYYKLDYPVSLESLGDTEVKAVHGLSFIYGDYVVYVNKMILKNQGESESLQLLQAAFDGLKVSSESFSSPEEALEVYFRVGK
ncbi:MAG: hypothetical protein ILP18_03400 [Treponema sp.]|nr:hypothetical protein [Treponema sp.]